MHSRSTRRLTAIIVTAMVIAMVLMLLAPAIKADQIPRSLGMVDGIGLYGATSYPH